MRTPSDNYDGDLNTTRKPSFANEETEAQRDSMLVTVHTDLVLCRGDGIQCLTPPVLSAQHRTAKPLRPVSPLPAFSSCFLKEPRRQRWPLHPWLLLEQQASLKPENLCSCLSIWCSLNLEHHAAVDFEDSLLSSLLKIAPAIPLAAETSEAPTERANLSPGELTHILPNSFWPDHDPRHQSQKEEKVG